MNGDTTITAGGGDVLGQAGEDILLGVIRLTHSTANRAALSAGRSILDTNEALVNVTETVAASATSLSLRATSGTIGATGGAIPTVNDFALDLNVDTVAATSAGGIFLRELASGGAIEVNTAAAVTVDLDGVLQANFNSTRTDVSQTRTLAALEDLTTTANGAIQLLAENGSITVHAGAATTSGVFADGTGNLLLEARGTASDVVLNRARISGTGNVTLIAGDDVSQNADLTTSGGSVYLLGGNRWGSGPLTINVADTMNVSGRIVSGSGVLTLDVGHDLRFVSTTLVQSASGVITMIAGTATPACDGELFMADGAMIDAGAGFVSLTADDDITLGQVITKNSTTEAIRITSNCAAIIDGGDAGVANIVAESATARVSLQAVTGIGSAAGGGTDAADVLIGDSGNGVTGQIQSRGGNVVVLADDDAHADAGSGGELLMRDGAVIDAADGTIELRADEDITLATIRTSNATAVTLVTRRGGVAGGQTSHAKRHRKSGEKSPPASRNHETRP